MISRIHPFQDASIGNRVQHSKSPPHLLNKSVQGQIGHLSPPQSFSRVQLQANLIEVHAPFSQEARNNETLGIQPNGRESYSIRTKSISELNIPTTQNLSNMSNSNTESSHCFGNREYPTQGSKPGSSLEKDSHGSSSRNRLSIDKHPQENGTGQSNKYHVKTPLLSKEFSKSNIHYYTQENCKTNGRSSDPYSSPFNTADSTTSDPQNLTSSPSTNQNDSILNYLKEMKEISENGTSSIAQLRNESHPNFLKKTEKGKNIREKNSEMFRSSNTIKSESMSINSFSAYNSHEPSECDKSFGKSFQKQGMSEILYCNSTSTFGTKFQLEGSTIEARERQNQTLLVEMSEMKAELEELRNKSELWRATESKYLLTIDKNEMEMREMRQELDVIRNENIRIEYELKKQSVEMTSLLKLKEENLLLNKKLLECKVEYYRAEQDLKNKYQVSMQQIEKNTGNYQNKQRENEMNRIIEMKGEIDRYMRVNKELEDELIKQREVNIDMGLKLNDALERVKEIEVLKSNNLGLIADRQDKQTNLCLVIKEKDNLLLELENMSISNGRLCEEIERLKKGLRKDEEDNNELQKRICELMQNNNEKESKIQNLNGEMNRMIGILENDKLKVVDEIRREYERERMNIMSEYEDEKRQMMNGFENDKNSIWERVRKDMEIEYNDRISVMKTDYDHHINNLMVTYQNDKVQIRNSMKEQYENDTVNLMNSLMEKYENDKIVLMDRMRGEFEEERKCYESKMEERHIDELNRFESLVNDGSKMMLEIHNLRDKELSLCKERDQILTRHNELIQSVKEKEFKYQSDFHHMEATLLARIGVCENEKERLCHELMLMEEENKKLGGEICEFRENEIVKGREYDKVNDDKIGLEKLLMKAMMDLEKINGEIDRNNVVNDDKNRIRDEENERVCGEMVVLREEIRQLTEELEVSRESYVLEIEEMKKGHNMMRQDLENQLNCQNEEIRFIENVKDEFKADKEELLSECVKLNEIIERLIVENNQIKNSFNLDKGKGRSLCDGEICEQGEDCVDFTESNEKIEIRNENQNLMKIILRNYDQLNILVGLSDNIEGEELDEKKIEGILESRHNKVLEELMKMGEKIQDLKQENEFLCVKVSETELENKVNNEEREGLANSLIIMECNNLNLEKQIEMKDKSISFVESKLAEALELSVREGELVSIITDRLLNEKAKILSLKYNHLDCLGEENESVL